ncbi:hypothetical protein HHI36_013922 [Cryptolaemus montrouzieri]|uniref:Oligopeptide transport permease C-like N-terminal domain-containing protein n=1 Tax=Cryptolaemus montrouzieri TaxID=559131 RepID=A0ABD2N1Z1_9CUCU
MESRLLIHDFEAMSSSRDWRKALKKPPAYRIINRTFGFRNKQQFYKMVSYLGIAAILGVFVIYSLPNISFFSKSSNYNNTYPLTAPVIANNVYTYRIGIIADLDTDSKHESEKTLGIPFSRKAI